MEEHWSTGAPVFLGVDGALGGCLLLEDEVKEELRDSLLALRELQAADVVLLKDSLDQLVSVVRIGKQTMRKVKQNIGMSLDFRRPDR